jgi:hypothetical protein
VNSKASQINKRNINAGHKNSPVLINNLTLFPHFLFINPV